MAPGRFIDGHFTHATANTPSPASPLPPVLSTLLSFPATDRWQSLKKKKKKNAGWAEWACDHRAMIIHPGIERLWAERALVVMQDEDSWGSEITRVRELDGSEVIMQLRERPGGNEGLAGHVRKWRRAKAVRQSTCRQTPSDRRD